MRSPALNDKQTLKSADIEERRPRSSPPRPPPDPPSVFPSWWFETLAAAIALASFCILVGILMAYEHKLAPQWPQSLTINTVVAILSTLMKSCMLLIVAEGISHLKWAWFTESRPLWHLSIFDRASRGPTGALQLLGIVRTHHTIVSLGGIITILVFAIDPFAQQLIRFYNCTILQAGNATVPRSNLFLTDFNSLSALDIQTSMLTSILTDSIPNASFVCPSGNCTFPNGYTTIGYCSSCADVSHEIKWSWSNQTDHGPTQESWCVIMNASLPSGLISVYNDCQLPTIMTSFVSNGFNTSAGYLELLFTSDLLWLLSAGFDIHEGPDCADTTDWQCSRVGAARCYMYPCVQTHSPSNTAGRILDVVLDTSKNQDWGLDTGGMISLVDLSCLTGDQLHSLVRDIGHEVEQNYSWLPYCDIWNNSTELYEYSICPTPNLTVTTATAPSVPQECIYSYDPSARNAVEQYLTTLFAGSVGDSGQISFTGPTTLQMFATNTFKGFDSGLFNTSFEKVSQKMNNLATSLSNRITFTQNESPDHHDSAVGLIWQAETCVQVRWWWLAYPVTMLLMSVCFLVAILLGVGKEVASTSCMRDWKSNPLPLVLPGLRESDGQKDEPERPLTERQMRTFTERRNVKVEMDEYGRRFVRSELTTPKSA